MKLFKVIDVDGVIRSTIQNRDGSIKVFTKDGAEKYIETHSYKGMSYHYEIEEIEDDNKI